MRSRRPLLYLVFRAFWYASLSQSCPAGWLSHRDEAVKSSREARGVARRPKIYDALSSSMALSLSSSSTHRPHLSSLFHPPFLAAQGVRPLRTERDSNPRREKNREAKMTGDDGSCASRAARAAAFGAASGGALGAARATWSPSAPVILQGRSLPALMRTGERKSSW